jgi:hypothetical protein
MLSHPVSKIPGNLYSGEFAFLALLQKWTALGEIFFPFKVNQRRYILVKGLKVQPIGKKVGSLLISGIKRIGIAFL